jgi:hypothetical protein
MLVQFAAAPIAALRTAKRSPCIPVGSPQPGLSSMSVPIEARKDQLVVYGDCIGRALSFVTARTCHVCYDSADWNGAELDGRVRDWMAVR